MENCELIVPVTVTVVGNGYETASAESTYPGCDTPDIMLSN
jgi:hypothetical protein